MTKTIGPNVWLVLWIPVFIGLNVLLVYGIWRLSGWLGQPRRRRNRGSE